jgi:SAM-dependent methyltransferase/catechol 2,3-dioxygenase-like lactoylglutathione lyase family enzyme
MDDNLIKKRDLKHVAARGLDTPLVLRDIRCVILPVRDRSNSLIFYRDKLGMMARALPDGTWEVSTGHTALRLIEHPLKKDRITVTFCLPIWELMKARDKLRALGLQVNGPSERLGTEQILTLKDPDNHNIELVARGSISDMAKSRIELSEKRGRGPSGQTWEYFYNSVSPEDMPWYTDCLDEELIVALSEYAPLPGRLLELGSGPGTASARLAALGYEVVAVDIATAAIEQARLRFGTLNPHLIYEIADVCQPLTYFGNFDYAFDRGCFHGIPPEEREQYIHNVAEVIRPGGRLFLKVFSCEEPGDRGPYRFTTKKIKEIFKETFTVCYATKSTFEGTLVHSPKGLFFVLQK